MEFGLRGKVALVCAASQGLGLASAAALAAEGVELVVCARTAETLETVAQHLALAHGITVTPVVCDLGSARDRTALLNTVLAQYPQGVDIVVHNNGGPAPSTVLETAYTEWTNGYNALFLSVMQLNQTLVPLMQAKGWGRVLSISSIAALEPVVHLPVSNAVRSALGAYLKTLATSVAAQGVTVNTIAPGYIATGRLTTLFTHHAEQRGGSPLEQQQALEAEIPAQRLGQVEEFGATVAFLASQQAAYITGHTLVVDGGKRKATH